MCEVKRLSTGYLYIYRCIYTIKTLVSVSSSDGACALRNGMNFGATETSVMIGIY